MAFLDASWVFRGTADCAKFDAIIAANIAKVGQSVCVLWEYHILVFNHIRTEIEPYFKKKNGDRAM
jgi:hypothetical protein